MNSGDMHKSFVDKLKSLRKKLLMRFPEMDLQHFN